MQATQVIQAEQPVTDDGGATLATASVRTLAATDATDAFTRDRLLGSVLSRARQSLLAVFVMTFLTGLFLYSLAIDISRVTLGVWFGAVMLMLTVRFAVGRRALASTKAEGYPAAVRFDRYFRGVSFVSQIVVGAGIWMAVGVPSAIAGYVITLLVMFYGVGTMVNLAHDYRTFVISAPLLLLQSAVYWFSTGADGFAMAFGCIGMLGLMVMSVRTSQSQFDASIRMGHEKNDLLRALDATNVELNKALAVADRANRAKGFFLATASHDLRQPIIAAALLGESLQRLPLADDALRGLADQGSMLRELHTMLDNVLDLARFEEGVVQAELRPVSIASIFESMRVTFGQLCAQRGLRMNISSTDLWVLTDAALLRRMLGNLMSNAVKYTDRGGVGLHAECIDDAVVVSVSDTGRGISEADSQRMFEAFVRLPGGPEQEASGAGLGLAIVRGIANVLGLEPLVESKLGAGTRISFALPLADALPAARAASTQTSTQTMVQRLGEQDALRGLVLWIVGAAPAWLGELDTELLQLGCMCGMASNLEECQALFDDGERPSLLIVDEAVADARPADALVRWAAGSMSGLPMLVLTDDTASAAEVRLAPCLDAGVNGCQDGETGALTVAGKPVGHDVLVTWLLRHKPR